MNVTSANILNRKVTSSGKSFCIRKNNAPKTDPCGIPTKTFFHEDLCPFKKTCSCQSFE